jgi:hypothetical protein
LPDTRFAGATLTNTLPPQSITLFVLPAIPGAGTQIAFRSVSVASGQVTLQLTAPVPEAFRVEQSADCRTWSTAIVASSTNSMVTLNLSASGPAAFYRAVAE